MEQSLFIKALSKPTAKAVAQRRVDAINVDLICDIATASVVANGYSPVSKEARGHAVGVSTNKDGTVKFTNAGKIAYKVHPEVQAYGHDLHNNFIATLTAEVQRIKASDEAAWNAEKSAEVKAATPIINRETALIAEAIAAKEKVEEEARLEAEIAAEEAAKAEKAAIAKAKKTAEAKANKKAEDEAAAAKERELEPVA